MKKIMEGIKEKGISIILFIVYMTVGVLPLNLYAEGESGERIKINNSILLASKVIGKEGGIIEGDGVIFEVPKGALEKEVEIKISRLIRVEEGEVKNVTAGLGGYRFEPSGIKFKKECLIKMAYDERIEEEYAKEIYTYYYNKRKKAWEALKRKGVDVEKKVIESYTNHFTDMINGTLSLPESPGPVNINLNSIKELKAADAVGGIERIEGLKGVSEGSASFNMKLQLPGGVRGFTPELAVSYSSGSGYGVLGKGFSLSGIESISIDTRLGLPEYNGKDTYIINGIKVRYEGGKWKEERKQSYAAIKNEWAERKGSENYFEIREKDGSVKIYGLRNWSGISEGKKYIYYLDEIRDSFGNIIEYNYENGKSVEGEEVVLKEIVYGKERERRIKIEYEGREDVRVEGRGKYLKKESKRIREIRSEVKGEEVKTYKFNYKENTFLESLLDSIEVTGRGREEGKYAYRFEYEDAGKYEDGSIRVFGETERWYKGSGILDKNTGGIRVTSGNSKGANISGSGGIGVGDLTGKYDGRITVGGGGSKSSGNSVSEQLYLDINGDGRPDAVSQCRGGFLVSLNTGNGFGPAEKWDADIEGIEKEVSDSTGTSLNVYGGIGTPDGVPSPGFTYSRAKQDTITKLKTSFSDINGDGFIDIVIEGAGYYLRNTGKRFVRTEFENIDSLKIAEIKLDKAAAKEYNDSFYQQNPFRNWIGRYNGKIEIETEGRFDDGESNYDEIWFQIYKGNKKISNKIINEGNRYSHSINEDSIKGRGNLYFVPYGECKKSGQRIKWNVKVRYKSIEPFSDMENVVLWRVDRESILKDTELEILRGKEYEDEYTWQYVVKDDWQEILNEGINKDNVEKTKAAYYLIKNGYFVPKYIYKEDMDLILQARGYEGDDKQKELKKLLISMYTYEITSEKYILHDKDVLSYKFKDWPGRNPIDKEIKLRNVFKNIDVQTLEKILRYKNKYIRGLEENIYPNKGLFTGDTWEIKGKEKRREVKFKGIGYIDTNGDIYLDKIDNKFVILKNRKIFLEEEEFGEVIAVEESYRQKRIKTKINSNKIVLTYELNNYQPKAFKLSYEEFMKVWKENKGYVSYTLDNEKWKKINKGLYLKIEKMAEKLKGEEGKLFIGSVYKISEEGNHYNIKEEISEEEKERLNKILIEYGLSIFIKERKYEYDDIEKIYNLKDIEALNLLTKEELLALEGEAYTHALLKYNKLKDDEQNIGLGRYDVIKTYLKYDKNNEYQVMDYRGEHPYIRLPIFENGILKSKNIFIETWDSAKDFSNNQLSEEVIKYTEAEKRKYKELHEVEENGEKIIKEVEVEKIINIDTKCGVKEFLSGGNKQWYYGVWIKDQNYEENAFSEEKLKRIAYESSNAINKDINDMESNKDNISKNLNGKETPLYYPIRKNEEFILSDGQKITPIKKEAESKKDIDEQYYIGNVSESLSENEDSLQKYCPYIKEDLIFINRSGGTVYYTIPGIKPSNLSGISIRRSVNKSKEDSFSPSLNYTKIFNVIKSKDIEDLMKGLADEMEKIQEISISGDISRSTSRGKSYVDILLSDVNGDGKADIIQKEGQNIKVSLGDGKGFEKEYYIQDLSKIIETSDKITSTGGGVSGGGVNKKVYSSKGKLLYSTIVNPISTGANLSKSKGSGVDETSFMDINGDGLPDSVRKECSYLNCGDKVCFVGDNILKVNLGKTETHTVSGVLNLSTSLSNTYANEGVKTDTVSANLSGSLSYSGSYTDTKRQFVNLRGHLPDMMSLSNKNNAAVITVNTGGKIEKEMTINLPEWDLSSDDKAKLFFVSDANLGVAFLKNIPGLGKYLNSGFDSAVLSDGLALNPLSAFLIKKINCLNMSSTVNFGAGTNGGVSGNVLIPLTGYSLNLSFSAGAGVNASGRVSGVNVSMLDMDGDGLADRVLRIPGSNGAVYVQRNLLGKVGLLKKIKLPQGGSYELKYERVGNTVELPQAKYVLSEVTARSGLKTKTGNEQAYTTYYTYEDGYYNRIEKEFYGFKTVRSKNAIGTVTETEYYTDSYYRKGMVKRETVKNGSKVYSIKEYEVDTAPHARIKKEVNTVREGYSEIKTESEYEYDKYGNVTKLYDKGDVTNTNDDIIAEINYWKGGNQETYFKAHPEKIQVLHGKTGTLLRKREGAYDSRTGALVELKQYTSNSSFLLNRIEWTDEGNIKALTGPTGKRSEYKYLDGIYPIEIKEVSSKGEAPYTSEIEWDSVLGVKLKETDAANNTMSYKYDNFGRVTEVRSPYDFERDKNNGKIIKAGETPYARYEYHTPADSFWYTVTGNKISTEAEDSAVMKTIVIHDGLGRISYTAKEGEVYVDGTENTTQTGWNISSVINYDKAGRKSEEGMPFFYGGNLEQELVNKNSYQALESFYELNNFTTIRNGTKYEYDDIDRNILTVLPDGHTQRNEYSIDASLQITKATDPLENISISKKDARGNIREVERLDKNNSILTKAKYEYSVLGEMLKAYDAKDNLLAVNYDMLGRRISLESKDTGKKEWIYDDKGQLYAETDSVLKNKAAEIRYEYDGFDRIVKTDYPFSQDIEYKYGAPRQNGAGQIVYKKDETGETRYKYGYLNEVTKETRTINRYGAGSNPETASFEYRLDYLGRMQSMKYPDGETITYTYDKGGQLKGVSGVKTSSKGTAEYSYVNKILYDEHAQRVYIKYGNGVETRYKYDEKRRWLDTIETKNIQTQDVFQKIKYNFDAVGNVLGYNNDVTTYETQQTYSYDSLYQLISVEGTSNQYKGKKSFGMTPVSVAKYKQTFAFDAIGNMTNKLSTTNIPGSQGNSYPKAELDYDLNYEYDPAYAHRLIHAGTRYYRYDANGNITAEKDGPFTDEEEFTFTYSYFENEDVYGADYGFGLDAPKETEQTNPQDLFAYRRNYTWNERNLLTKSSDRNFTVHYRYGDDGQRALKYTDEGRSETLYFNNFFTIHIPTQDQNNPQGLRVHKHIFVGNSRLVTAMTHTDNQGDNEEQKAKRYYYHSDHLGSAQFVTDWKGRQYEHIEYTPYGELWIEEVAAGLDKLPFRFTGKELDEETGLYYYGARYLDPKYSRWLSGDPALNDYMAGSSLGEGGIYNTVNFNVYHYGGNNPIKYIDPNGMWINNGDGTYIAEKGDTLYGLYEDDWKEKSGFDRDPRTLQPGEVVGKKTDSNGKHKQNNELVENILTTESIDGNILSSGYDTPDKNKSTNNTNKNILYGIVEMFIGIGIVAGTIYIVSKAPPTAEMPWVKDSLLLGFGLFAHGLTRVSGVNKNSIQEDIKSIFMPIEASVGEEYSKYKEKLMINRKRR
ncbi:toxin TcdB middle/N-terminal domain-containing protein [Treponema denticola]|uniref:toxin TcdB middle/N-terminal domain-containing protein n=1 Tax=Treponema denticola TaxID=158 RepID=UPI0020A3B214|nr:toxin TcdB middle/N-terminal domain-containing protein [Treponema denticola]